MKETREREYRKNELLASCTEAVLQGAPLPQPQTPLDEELLAELQGALEVVRQLAETVAPSRPARLGHYELGEVLGEGGFGTVYRAVDTRLNRVVAVKVARLATPTTLAGQEFVRRFRLEVEAVAGLDHPNIVHVYEAGEAAGQLYYSMQFIDGGPLTAAVPRFQSHPAAAARLVAQVARAVHHAHQRGILHRDLKPANVLLSEASGGREEASGGREEASGGRKPPEPACDHSLATSSGGLRPPLAGCVPHVADFGLARRLGQAGQAAHSSHGAVGTLEYMAPEQARGERDLTVAVDVYGLGAILYELLTGRPPYRGDSPAAVLAQVLEQSPPPPRAVNPAIDRDLETICLKCLQREPGKRYASAPEVADDLERWLRGEPIRARRVPAWERLVKWARRRPAQAALVLLLVLLLGGGAAWGWQAHARRQEALAAQAEIARRAEQALDRAAAALQRAQQTPHADLEAWKADWATAQVELRRAEELLRATAPGELRARLDELKHELAQVKRDREMLADLFAHQEQRLTFVSEPRFVPTRPSRKALLDVFEYRGRILTIPSSNASRPRTEALDVFDHGRVARRYAELFAKYGIDVERLPPAEAAEQLKARPIRVELADAVFDWAVALAAQDIQNPRWKRLAAVAEAAETSPWRKKVRTALLDSNQATLAEVTKSDQAADLPVATLILLGQALGNRSAEQLLRRAQQRNAGNALLAFQLGTALFRQVPPQPSEGVRFLQVAAALSPKNPVLRSQLAAGLLKAGRQEEAIQMLEDLVARFPRLAFAHSTLGVAYANQGKYQKALPHFEEVVRLWPDHPFPRYHLGRVLMALERFAEARKVLRRALKQAPADVRCLLELVRIEGRQERFAEAQRLAERAVELAPKHAEALHLLGVIYTQRRRAPQARATLEKAVRLDGKDGEAWLSLGIARAGGGDWNMGAEALVQAVLLMPDHPRAHAVLGMIQERLGNWTDALAAYRRAVRLDSQDTETRERLAGLLHMTDQPAAAIEVYRDLVRRSPSAERYFQLGRVLVRQGEIAGALKAFERCLFLRGQGPTAVSPTREQLLREVHLAWQLNEIGTLLPGVRRGEVEPESSAGMLAVARLFAGQRRHVSAAYWYLRAFAADPALASDPALGQRYMAAVTAARAGQGQDSEGERLDAAGQAAFRKQALLWLGAELKACKEAGRSLLVSRLRRCRHSAAFAGLRQPEELARLPGPERAAWRAFWAEVDRLLDALSR